MLLFPRGDLRRTTERVPSRFLVESLAATSPERLPDDLAELRADWYTPVPSFAAGLARVEFPATEQEHRLRALLDHTRAGHAVGEHELRDVDVALRRGIDTVTARASHRFTRFDGNLAGFDAGRVTDDDVVVSPTRLQTYAGNPFDYFLEYVLRVDIAELPEERYEVSPLDRGSLVHETLDTFLAEVLARPGGAPAPDTPWTGADRSRLREIADARCAVYEAQGRTGRRLFWHRDRRRILAELDRFLTVDSATRAEFGLRPVATELRFGFSDSAPAVDLHLSDDRVLRFRGAADRVDRTASGALWVIDYKTGWPYGVDPDDPTAAGTMLQLPVYAHAARGVVRRPRHARGRRVLVREHARAVPVGRARAHARGRRARRPCAAHHRRRHRRGRVPLPGRPADHVDAPVPQLHRSRRARHPRPVPRVDTQARRPRAAGLRDARRTGSRRRRPRRRRRMTAEKRRSGAVLRERDGGAESTIGAVQQSFLDLDEDLATRAAIVEALDDTLFVEAGAGSGKTKALVDRVVALITQRDVPMREIAAVTFTEKAAAELRDRIRRALEETAREGSGVAAARAAGALEELDGAAVSTLHAFAQRLLTEHPIEAGLPPRIEVLDDIASQLAFEERWARFVDELLDDPELERVLLLALNADTTLPVLRTLALACNANWDFVAERMGPEPDPPPLVPVLEPLLVALAGVRTRAAQCLDPGDKLLEKVLDLAAWHDELLHAPDEYEQMRLLNVGTPGATSATAGRTTGRPHARPTTSGPRSRPCASS